MRAPLASLIFLSPILLAYETGVLVLGAESVRNGCDVWLRTLLQTCGFGQYFLLPCVTVFVLVGWHYVTRHPWQTAPDVLVRMGWESMVFAVLLLLWSQLQFECFQVAIRHDALVQVGERGPEFVPRLVGFLGAGIYEELLFRLLLIPILSSLLMKCGEPQPASLWTAAIASSALFAAAHYGAFVGVGDVFRWTTFSFRFIAGLAFAAIFLWRGFGIAVGAHFLYDVLAIVSTPID